METYEQIKALIGDYTAKFGATFSAFRLLDDEELMILAKPLLESAIQPDGKPIYDTDLGLKAIPQEAMF